MKAVKGKYYFGGIHPHGMKKLASPSALEVLPEPETVAISTSQSLGKPAAVIVEAGKTVKIGEVIAKADGPVSSDVFASVSGTVTEIKDLTGTGGAEEKFIFIKSDGKGETSFLAPLTNPSPDEIKARIKEAGIVGLGGAGFPTAIKVSPKTKVDTLIINGAECEPYLTCDHRLMLEKADAIAQGARYIAKALGVEKIIIGIEKNKPDCIEVFEKYDDIQPVVLAKKYPMGGEKQLIYVTTGRKVGLGKLPADVGVVVQNVATCYAVYEAVELGKPLYERALTVSGKAVKQPKNLWVKVGTPYQNIIDFCGGEQDSIKTYTHLSEQGRQKLLKKLNREEEKLAAFKEKNEATYKKLLDELTEKHKLEEEKLAALKENNSSSYEEQSEKLLKKHKLEEGKLTAFKENSEAAYEKRFSKKLNRDEKRLKEITPKKVIQGGPMTGVALASLNAYTHKTTSAILLLTEKEAAADEPTPCLNCGKCADVCPMHLMPMNTAFYSAAGDFESAAKYGQTLACIECGACEYICPAKRPLIQAIRKTKAALREKKEK